MQNLKFLNIIINLKVNITLNFFNVVLKLRLFYFNLITLTLKNLYKIFKIL